MYMFYYQHNNILAYMLIQRLHLYKLQN